MSHEILKPLQEEELKVMVGEFINSFIVPNKKNQASLDELKESYHESDLMLYHILRKATKQFYQRMGYKFILSENIT